METLLSTSTRFPVWLEFSVSLTPEQILDRVATHPEVRESLHAYPYPPPPHAGRFLLCRADEHGFWLRHYAGPLDSTSPIACVSLHERPWGTKVRGRFVVGVGAALPTRGHFQTRFLATLLVGIAGMPLMGPVALTPLFAYLGQTYFIHNARWNAEMRAYGPALLGFMGEVFAPFVLPEPGQSLRDPYRATMALQDVALQDVALQDVAAQKRSR